MNFRATFETKKILILGFGREGQDVLRFLRGKFPAKEIGIADQLAKEQLPPKAKEAIGQWCSGSSCKFHFGSRYLRAVPRYDVIIKSPGIPLRRMPKLRKNQILTSETKIFFEFFPGTIVGITGTKGKSTTAKLIYETLKTVRPSIFLIGNIGRPALGIISRARKKSIAVYELSSFQLADLDQSPQIAVVLNIFPEHLDWHGEFSSYRRAKTNIVKYQHKNDACVFDASNEYAKIIAQKSKGRKIAFSLPKKGVFSMPIPSGVDVKSLCAAKRVAKIFHVPESKMKRAFAAFKALPHRLEYIGTHGGIRFYDDSLSTIPEATIRALDLLGEDVTTLILGGFDRGISFDGLAKALRKSALKTIILFPNSGARIKQAIEKFQISLLRQRLRTSKADFRPSTRAKPRSRTSTLLDRSSTELCSSAGLGAGLVPHRNKVSGAGFQNKFQFFQTKSMREAVRFAHGHTSKGKICLLSPASPSFGIFRDYEDRGEQFAKYIKLLAK